MKYNKTVKGTFLRRPNRFIAEVMVDGEKKICHVKNTGRCRELLKEGATVILERSDNPARKTEYDLIAVYKGDKLINMDSVAPNKAFYEWSKSSELFKSATIIKPESTYGNSRFDFYIELGERKIFVEVKGVTLESDGVVMFPDAPTERGVKHIKELVSAVENGYEAYVFFIIQMKDCKYFTPNREMHKEFADALINARQKGVNIAAVNCDVYEDEMTVSDFVKIIL